MDLATIGERTGVIEPGRHLCECELAHDGRWLRMRGTIRLFRCAIHVSDAKLPELVRTPAERTPGDRLDRACMETADRQRRESEGAVDRTPGPPRVAAGR